MTKGYYINVTTDKTIYVGDIYTSDDGTEMCKYYFVEEDGVTYQKIPHHKPAHVIIRSHVRRKIQPESSFIRSLLG